MGAAFFFPVSRNGSQTIVLITNWMAYNEISTENRHCSYSIQPYWFASPFTYDSTYTNRQG